MSLLSHTPVSDKNQAPTHPVGPACHPGSLPVSHMLLGTHLYTFTFVFTHLDKIHVSIYEWTSTHTYSLIVTLIRHKFTTYAFVTFIYFVRVTP